MFFVPVFSIVAFIVILADLKWKWVELIDTQKVNFAHSIIGIIVIGMSLIQVYCLFLNVLISFFFTKFLFIRKFLAN